MSLPHRANGQIRPRAIRHRIIAFSVENLICARSRSRGFHHPVRFPDQGGWLMWLQVLYSRTGSGLRPMLERDQGHFHAAASRGDLRCSSEFPGEGSSTGTSTCIRRTARWLQLHYLTFSNNLRRNQTYRFVSGTRETYRGESGPQSLSGQMNHLIMQSVAGQWLRQEAKRRICSHETVCIRLDARSFAVTL